MSIYLVTVGPRSTRIYLTPKRLEAYRDQAIGPVSEEHEALALGIKKLFGAKASFWSVNGHLGSLGFGQVVEPMPRNPGAYNCLTPQVRASAEKESQ